jgi:predicted bacteriocin transport accessory protein
MLTACGKNDAIKFKEEYEALNGTTSKSGSKIRELTIDENNPIIYKTADEVVEMIENKETFVVYFGFAACPWCRSVLPTLFKVSNDLGLDKIYYVDVLDIRDTLELDSDNHPITKTKGTDAYYKLLDLLNDVLDDYSMKDADGNPVDTSEKRIYAPNVVAISKGKALQLETGISDDLKDPYSKLTIKIKKYAYKKFDCLMDCFEEESTSCKKNSC